MPVNADKIHLWKEDVARSVDHYNAWFLEFAPKAYRQTRQHTTQLVEAALVATSDLRDISPAVLRESPKVLQMLRMSTAPPIARDRLIGLAGVPSNLVFSMEENGTLPARMSPQQAEQSLEAIGRMIGRLADKDIFTWLDENKKATANERYRAATIVADRLCGAVANPIIRNAQEARQLAEIKQWLESRKYRQIADGDRVTAEEMPAGSFCFRLNVPVHHSSHREAKRHVNIPIDAAVKPHKAKRGDMPLLIEAKSAGDFTNTNKRRKEEAQKIGQLRKTYGPDVRFILFLCGYFDSGYLGYEAAEGIDWVWEHRIDDLAKFGL